MKQTKKKKKNLINCLYRKQTEVNKAANAENHTSCIQNEWQQEKKREDEGGRGDSQFSQLRRRDG